MNTGCPADRSSGGRPVRPVFFYVGAALILLLSWAVRRPGIHWGLRDTPPHYYHPDEQRLCMIALHLQQHGTPNDFYPFGFPNQIAAIGRVITPRPTIWRQLVLPARCLSAAYGVGTTLLVIALAGACWRRRSSALAAGAAYALAGLPIAHAHFGTADTGMVFWFFYPSGWRYGAAGFLSPAGCRPRSPPVWRFPSKRPGPRSCRPCWRSLASPAGGGEVWR